MANRTKRISPVRQQAMVDQYQAGKSRLQIAKEMGSSITTVTQTLQKHAVELRPFRIRKVPAADFPKVIERYQAGEYIEALAASYGCTDEVIRKILKRHEVERRDDRGRRREYTPEEIAVIRQMAADGASQNQIAQVLGSAQGTIAQLMRKEGIPPARRGNVRGEQHGAWKGGRTRHADGYWLVTLDPTDPFYSMSKQSGTVLEHRLVMARSIGRPLLPTETVHHIDGDRSNNRPENLQLRQGQHGNGAAFRCRDCGSHNIEATKIAERA